MRVREIPVILNQKGIGKLRICRDKAGPSFVANIDIQDKTGTEVHLEAVPRESKLMEPKHQLGGICRLIVATALDIIDGTWLGIAGKGRYREEDEQCENYDGLS